MEVQMSLEEGNIHQSKIYFYQGDVLLTERDFEELVQDLAIQENKRKLKEVTNVGFGSTLPLLVWQQLLIPSVVFALKQIILIFHLLVTSKLG